MNLPYDAKVRVASYNVRKCVGLDRRTLPERVLGVISRVEANVVAIQEVDARLGQKTTSIPRELINEHTDMEPVDLAQSEFSLGWHGNAILVRKGTKIIATDQLNLPGFEARGAALVEIEHQGHAMRIVATHLGLLRHNRRQQAQSIVDQLEDREAMPTLVLGDLNEWSRTRGLEALYEKFDVHAPGRSFHSARPVAALDRIAASSELKLTDAGVDQRGDALKASDHLPIWADFTLANSTTTHQLRAAQSRT